MANIWCDFPQINRRSRNRLAPFVQCKSFFVGFQLLSQVPSLFTTTHDLLRLLILLLLELSTSPGFLSLSFAFLFACFRLMDSWRIAVLGDGGVGKTALAVQFTLNCFVETYDPTIEDAYRRQFVVDNKMCFVEVIDTAGQEEYATLRDQWVREGQGFILVYSIASRSTFERVSDFYHAMKRAKKKDAPFILVGNKCDKSFEREVSRDEGVVMAKNFGCRFLETSAKTAQNVEDSFVGVVRDLRRIKDKEAALSLPAKKEKFWSKCIIF